MRKMLLILMIAGMATLNSCRESTEQKTEEAVEAIGRDIEDGTREASKKIEEGAKKVKDEVQEEIDHIDIDHNNGEEPAEEI